MDTLRRRRLVDKLVESYVDWLEACARVNDSYRFCLRETGSAGRVAFGLYVAALDAEEHAAEIYAGLVQRAEQLSSSERPPAKSLGGPAWGVGS